MGNQSPVARRMQQKIDRQLHKRTEAALRERNERFAVEHGEESDGWLLDYLRTQAGRAGAEPYPCTIIGSAVIAARFGGWNRALEAAGLRPVDLSRTIPPTKTRLYKAEFRRQAQLRRNELETGKLERRAANREKEEAPHAEASEREKRDLAWGAAHRGDSDEELLDYLRACAEELGHTPALREVLGGYYLCQRFGSWAVAIHLAGLPFSRKLKRPNQKTVDAYWKARARRDQ